MRNKSAALTIKSHLKQVGKTSEKPGGTEHARRWIDAIGISTRHSVLEINPGSGTNTRLILKKKPRRYLGVNPKGGSQRLQRLLSKSKEYKTIQAPFEKTGLTNNCVDVVVTENTVSKYRRRLKSSLISEAKRVLKSGGICALHEIAATSSDINYRDYVNIGILPDKPLTRSQWRALLEAQGFEVLSMSGVPFHPYEAYRIVQDEGVKGALIMGINSVLNPKSKSVMDSVREVIRTNNTLMGLTIIAQKRC